MTSTLQQQLIFSLRSLDLYQKNKELQDVVDFLKQPDIKIKDVGEEKKLIKFILTLVAKYPEVIDDPHNQPLNAFFSFVFKNLLKLPPTEFKNKPPFTAA